MVARLDMLWRIAVLVVGVLSMIAFSIPFLVWLLISVTGEHVYQKLRGRTLVRDTVRSRWA